MDYGELLFKAHENNRNASNKVVRCYKTSFSPPQKVARSSNVSSDNIKKFLARREEEEKKKREEAARKKEELLALRSQDKKAQRRVQVMLKSTKSANKSVMEDAIDNINTADTLNGFKQCDEDDYGYVSQEASAFYNKLLHKYEAMPPEPPKFQAAKKEVKDLKAAKDRVRAALQKEAEEEMMPHKRKKRKHDSKDGENVEEEKGIDTKGEDVEVESKKDPPKAKIKKPPPPPTLKFDQILLIAEKKQFEPIMIDESLLKKEPERLMTKKEKLEYEKERERKLNRGKRPIQKTDTTSKDEPPKKLNKDNSIKNDSGKKCKTENTKSPINSSSSKIDKKPNCPAVSASKDKVLDSNEVTERLKKDSNVWSKSPNNVGTKSNIPIKKPSVGSPKTIPKVEKKTNVDNKGLKKEPINSDKNSYNKKLSELQMKIQLAKEENELLALKLKLKEKEVEMKKLESEKKDMAPKRLEPKKKIMKKPPPPPPPPQKKKVIPSAKRRIDSESEYDSELDDFIDDGPGDGGDYSKYISEIFGYDKSKYATIDDDEEEECMESNFAQISKEEFVSTKIGIMEDLEDIRKEQEEKRKMKEKKLKRLAEARKKKN